MKKEYLPLEMEIVLWQGYYGDICSASPIENLNDDKDGDWGMGGELPFD